MIARSRSVGGRARPTPSELQQEYRAYRRRQALKLVHMMPRDAIRPMVRAARRSGFENDDSLQMLVSYCEQLLPLPPIDVWEADRDTYREAHLRDLDASPEAPTAEAPSTVEATTFEYADQVWTASLNLFRDANGWRGFIAFEDSSSGRVHRTATIFREDNPAELRDRFLDFENASLQAFLRSALP